jgi:hypothetical protein
MPERSFLTSAVAILLVLAGHCIHAGDDVAFQRDIRPILSDRCFHCHGPDEEAREAELRFDTIGDEEGPFQDRGDYQVITPHNLQKSAIWDRLTTHDPDEMMPPAGSHKQPLSVAQKDLIRRWILQGAAFEDFWAFSPPVTQPVPPVADNTWTLNRLDRFVMSRLEKERLQPQIPGDKRTLIRRLTFDLTGLPPTRGQIHSFLDDRSPLAYQRLVDRLLATPHYGEHMSKYWLDLVRFADTNGMHHDHYREMTPYRDWIIRSFNDNIPFDQFLTFQLAGDLFHEPTLDQQIASGFNRLHLVIDVGTALPEESFHRNVVDRVTAFGTAILGLTLKCASCHDHKYDPLTQKDFYQLYAFFNNIDAGPEAPGASPHPPVLYFLDDQQRAEMQALEIVITETTEAVQTLKDKLKDDNGSETEKLPLTADLASTEARLKELTSQQNTRQRELPHTLVMKERDQVRLTHVRVRGSYDQLGEPVQRNTPAFLPALPESGGIKTRMDLAKWATNPQNPLVARVAVNRFWQQLFGVGLVKTAEDFGAQGEWPSHPKLLDDLAVQFVQSQWNVKLLIKSMVLSATYRQSSHTDPASFAADPENRLLARGCRMRLDSEMIRDQILAVSDLLVPTMYGKSVKPPQPPNLWKTVSMVSSSTYSFTADQGDKIYRRSLYSFWKRAMPPPQMTIFDAPTREACIARRERTNTPLQALVLMNEEQYFKAARKFALQILSETDITQRERILTAYESITADLPDDTETAALREGLRDFQIAFENDLPSAQALTTDLPLRDDQQRIDVAAYTMLINSLFNLDIVKTRE